MENECKFICSRGLLKSTDIHSTNPTSSNSKLSLDDFSQAKRGSILYVCNSAIRAFTREILPHLTEPFVLVSGDSDNSMPFGVLSEVEFLFFISSPLLKHWFCQNLLITHPKMTHMPIGLDYHTMSRIGEIHPWGQGALPMDQERALVACIQNESAPLLARYPLCYSNFHHSTWGIGSRGDRKEVVEKVPKHLVYYDPYFTSRDVAWNRQSQFAFVLSPMGGGYDCHRTWEALCLGCFPIVKSSGLDPVYEGLPVLIVKEWSDINETLLKISRERFLSMNSRMDKLTLAYWVGLFRVASEAC